MNILYVSIIDFNSLDEEGIYTDLLTEISQRGHRLYCVSPVERRNRGVTKIIQGPENVSILKVRVGNNQKTNVIEKGISTFLLDYQILHAVKKYFSNIKFDLILCVTPPISFAQTVSYIKKRDQASVYLLLKDIFPQNAVDIGILRRDSILYRYYAAMEKRLYCLADHIGCMSPANVQYVLQHNPYLDEKTVEECPNSIRLRPVKHEKDRQGVRDKFHIPQDVLVYIYGGNLGRPQGVSFLIRCLRENRNRKDVFFVICGMGTQYSELEEFVKKDRPENILLLPGLPKSQYNELLDACDVGLIFLDSRFTIPNFPSRLLSYMEYSLPVIACTDTCTDIGKVITDGNFGWWCESANASDFTGIIDQTVSGKASLKVKGRSGREFLENNYLATRSANEILKHLE